jgi:hypothetical protein
MKMRLFSLFGLTLFVASNCDGQTPAIWNNVQTNQSVNGIILDESGSKLVIWGNANDSCFANSASILVIDTSGTLLLDTSYELNSCRDEGAIDFKTNLFGTGYYLVTINDNITPQDCCFVHSIDANFALQWEEYLGRNVRSEIIGYAGRNYISTDNSSQSQNILRFYQPGIADTLNSVSLPYFSIAPQRILCGSGLVMEFGNQLNSDTAFVCMVYDTSGNYFTTFSFDADVTENEVLQYAAVHNNLIFHVSYSSGSRTHPASSGITGNINWVDTLDYQLHINGACIDTMNNIGYVFCDGISDRRLFSYNLSNGALLDSIILDSVYAPFTGIKSGPAGGVYLAYRKSNTDSLMLDQYDADFNLLWRGYTVHPTCSSTCNPKDFIIDELGYVYLVSSCSCVGAQILATKFAPSLVSVAESESLQSIQLFPNPASTTVTVSTSLNNFAGRIELYSSKGQLIFTDSLDGKYYTLKIELLSSGMYFVRVVASSGQVFTQKLFIQHQ